MVGFTGLEVALPLVLGVVLGVLDFFRGSCSFSGCGLSPLYSHVLLIDGLSFIVFFATLASDSALCLYVLQAVI